MKRFADLSITEGVIVQGLLDAMIARRCKISLSVDGEPVVKKASSIAEIEKAYGEYAFSSATLTVFGDRPEDSGVIVLVHGNEEDVISDYSVSLEGLIQPINDFINNTAAA